MSKCDLPRALDSVYNTLVKKSRGSAAVPVVDECVDIPVCCGQVDPGLRAART